MMGGSKKLLVNADDLGLVPGVNRGIADAFRRGIVSSASLLVNAPGFDDALSAIRENPSLSVGVHLTLVGGDGPVSDPASVPTLVDRRGCFSPYYRQFIMRYAAVKKSEIEREFSAQIERACASGITPTHLDTHQHLHLLPKVADVLIGLALQHRIRYIRCPGDRGGIMGPGISALARMLRRKIEKNGLETSDHFAGFDVSGRLTQKDLVRIIRHLGEGTTELMVHPGEDSREARSRYGWDMRWEEELSALVSPETTASVADEGVVLVGHGDITG